MKMKGKRLIVVLFVSRDHIPPFRNRRTGEDSGGTESIKTYLPGLYHYVKNTEYSDGGYCFGMIYIKSFARRDAKAAL